jgi:hypothetical protein
MSSIEKRSKKIYLICNGTSTNDIINSFNNSNKNTIGTKYTKKSFFSSLYSNKSIENNNTKKISKDNFSLLEEIGIKELKLCQENENIKNKVLNNLNIITSLDYNSIESALVLFYDNNIPLKTIYPFPYMSDETNIKNINIFNKFKENFGILSKNKSTIPITEYTNTNKYFKEKINKNKFLNIKNSKSRINWKYSNNLLSSSIYPLYSYKFTNFKELFEKNCLEKYKYRSDIDNDLYCNVIFCNSKLIIDFLKIFNYKKNIKQYNAKYDIIEYSSVWEIDVEIIFKINSLNEIIQRESKIDYDNYTKIYPGEYEYFPLDKSQNRNSNKYVYSYKYNNYKFILFNSLNNIPISYIKNLINFSRLSYQKTEQIKKKLLILKNNKKTDINNKSVLIENLS